MVKQSKQNIGQVYPWTLEMGAIGCAKTSVAHYESTLCNSAESADVNYTPADAWDLAQNLICIFSSLIMRATCSTNLLLWMIFRIMFCEVSTVQSSVGPCYYLPVRPNSVSLHSILKHPKPIFHFSGQHWHSYRRVGSLNGDAQMPYGRSRGRVYFVCWSPKICGFAAWNLLRSILLMSRILRLLLDF